MDCNITVKGVNIHYIRSGQGRPMILMHGWGGDNTTLRLFERVGTESHEVFNLDLPGFGKSEEPHESWGIEEYTLMLEEFVHTLGLKDPILSLIHI